MEIHQYIFTQDGYVSIHEHKSQKVWNANDQFVASYPTFQTRDLLLEINWTYFDQSIKLICVPEQIFKTRTGKVKAEHLRKGDEIYDYCIPASFHHPSDHILLAVYQVMVKNVEIIKGSFEVAFYDQDVICNGILIQKSDLIPVN
jgi:hypothetical protein